jgi:two-component system NtrC family sensor kinase
MSVYNANHLSHDKAANIALEISNNANNPALGLSFAKKALSHAKKINKPNLQAAAWLNIGQAQKKLGDNDEALESLINSAKLYKQAESQLGIASANLAIGNIYIQQQHYNMALQYYRNSIQVFRNLADTSRLSTTLLNIGEAFRLDQQYDSALLYFEEANKLFKDMQFEIGPAYACGNIGLVLTSIGRVDSGQLALEEAIETLQKVGDQYAIATYQLSMADIYNNNGELDKAIGFAEKSWNAALEYQLLEQLRDASKKLSELYSLKQDHQKAFEFQSKYIAYRDSINNEATIRKMADLRTDFEVAQKQTEIDLLNKTRQNQRLVQYGLILLSILVIIIALLLYRNNKFQKRANQMLLNQKEELARKNDKLDALIATREKFFSIISHDLRGPVNAFHGLSTIINSSIKEKQYSALPEVATHIEKAALHLSMLLDNLLSWAMNQKGSLPVNPENLNIKTISEEVVAIFANHGYF